MKRGDKCEDDDDGKYESSGRSAQEVYDIRKGMIEQLVGGSVMAT